MGNNCCSKGEEANYPSPVDIPVGQRNSQEPAIKGLLPEETEKEKQKNAEKEFHAKHEGEVDYDIIDTKDMLDEFEIFEVGLPFARTHLKRFIEKVDLAEEESGNKGFVTI